LPLFLPKTMETNFTDWTNQELQGAIKAMQNELAKRDKKPMTECRKIFEDFCMQHNMHYYYDVKEASNLKGLLNKISFAVSQKKGIPTRDVTKAYLITAFTVFVQKAYAMNDRFIMQNFTISILNNQFSKIVNDARHTEIERAATRFTENN